MEPGNFRGSVRDTIWSAMRTGESYRLRTELLGITTADRIPLQIPKGDVVKIVAASPGDRVVDVVWNSRMMMVFAQDLREHGELLHKTRKG